MEMALLQMRSAKSNYIPASLLIAVIADKTARMEVGIYAVSVRSRSTELSHSITYSHLLVLSLLQ